MRAQVRDRRPVSKPGSARWGHERTAAPTPRPRRSPVIGGQQQRRGHEAAFHAGRVRAGLPGRAPSRSAGSPRRLRSARLRETDTPGTRPADMPPVKARPAPMLIACASEMPVPCDWPTLRPVPTDLPVDQLSDVLSPHDSESAVPTRRAVGLRDRGGNGAPAADAIGCALAGRPALGIRRAGRVGRALARRPALGIGRALGIRGADRIGRAPRFGIRRRRRAAVAFRSGSCWRWCRWRCRCWSNPRRRSSDRPPWTSPAMYRSRHLCCGSSSRRCRPCCPA